MASDFNAAEYLFLLDPACNVTTVEGAVSLFAGAGSNLPPSYRSALPAAFDADVYAAWSADGAVRDRRTAILAWLAAPSPLPSYAVPPWFNADLYELLYPSVTFATPKAAYIDCLRRERRGEHPIYAASNLLTNNAGDVNVTSLHVTGPLRVDGAILSSNDLAIYGSLFVAGGISGGGTSNNGSLIVGGALNVGGEAVFGGPLFGSNDLTILGSLHVGGALVGASMEHVTCQTLDVSGVARVGDVVLADGGSFVRYSTQTWQAGASLFSQADGRVLSAGGPGSLVCRYQESAGFTVNATITMTLGPAEACDLGDPGLAWCWSLPVRPAAMSLGQTVGTAFLSSPNSTNVTGTVVINPVAANDVVGYTASVVVNLSAYGVGRDDPYAWGEGDSITLQLVYVALTQDLPVPTYPAYSTDANGNVYLNGRLQLLAAATLEYSAFAPAWNGTLGSGGTIDGRFRQVGRSVNVQIRLVPGVGGGGGGGGGAWTFALPFPAGDGGASSFDVNVATWISDGTALVPAMSELGADGAIRVRCQSGDHVGASVPFDWSAASSNASLSISLTYPVASYPIVPPIASAVLQAGSNVVGVGRVPGADLPPYSLDVVGLVRAGALAGDGASITNLNASAVAGAFVGDGAGLVAINACALATGTLDNARLPSAIRVATLGGDGAALANLNACALATGTLDNARLPATLRGENAAFAGAVATSNLVVGGTAVATAFAGDGDAIVNLNASALATGTVDAARLPPSVSNAAHLTAGVLDGARLPPAITAVLSGVGSNLVALNAAALLTGTVDVARLPPSLAALAAGSGADLVALNAAALSGTVDAARLPPSTLNAASLVTGTLDVARLPPSTLNAASLVVGTLSNARLPATVNVATLVASAFVGNGAALTGLNACALATGTLDNARLPVAINVATVAATTLVGSGARITALNACALTTGTLDNALLPAALNVASITTTSFATASLTVDVLACSGALLTSLNACALTTGTLSNARLPAALNVASLAAATLAGDGAALTALNASSIATGTISNARLPATLVASTFEGIGAALTALNACALASGTLENARLPSAIAASTFAGDGAALTDLNACALATGTIDNARLPSTLFAVNAVASNVTVLGALSVTGTFETVNAFSTHSSNLVVANLGTGTALVVSQSEAGALLGAPVATFSAGSNVGLLVAGGHGFVGVGGTVAPTQALDVSGNARVSGTVFAASFVGALNAAALTSGTLENARLPPDIAVTSLAGSGAALTALNASALAAGVVDTALLPRTVDVDFLVADASRVRNLNACALASGILNVALLPSPLNVDGSGLANLNASALVSGTLANARLPPTIAASVVGAGRMNPSGEFALDVCGSAVVAGTMTAYGLITNFNYGLFGTSQTPLANDNSVITCTIDVRATPNVVIELSATDNSTLVIALLPAPFTLACSGINCEIIICERNASTVRPITIDARVKFPVVRPLATTTYVAETMADVGFATDDLAFTIVNPAVVMGVYYPNMLAF